jgi:hypothetical protein
MVLRLRPPRIAPLTMAAAGSMLVFSSLLGYQIDLGSSSVVATRDIEVLKETADVTLGLIFLGLTLTFIGITRHLVRNSSGGSLGKVESSMTRLSAMISEKRSVKVFALAALSYGLFFGVVSSTLVFQPGLSFSDAYGVRVPSVVPVLCCSSVGQMPQLVVYITQQFAILIVPLNLVLLFSVSWLVGLNAAVASYAYVNRPQMAGPKWITGLGALVGLFTVCPSCAGFFFLTMIGLSGAVTLALTLSSLQTIFIAIGIPILLVMPIMASRGLGTFQACAVEKTESG